MQLLSTAFYRAARPLLMEIYRISWDLHSPTFYPKTVALFALQARSKRQYDICWQMEHEN